MADAEIPMELFLKIGKAMIDLSNKKFDLHTPLREEVRTLVKELSDLVLIQLRTEFPHLTHLLPETLWIPIWREELGEFFEVPSMMYAEDPQNLENVELMKQQWKTFSDMVVEHYLPPQQELSEQKISRISDREQSREATNQLS